jgi:Uma2 family endonuclease
MLPAPEERFPSRMPVLWIEILSQDYKILDVWSKAGDLIEIGVPNVWIINPNTLESELRTSAGVNDVPDRNLRLPDSPIVIPLLDVMAE